VEKSARLTKEEKADLRARTAETIAGIGPEGCAEAARRLLPLIIPDPKAEPGRTGLRTTLEVIQEVSDTILKKTRSKEKLSALVDGLWSTGSDEARATAAYCLRPVLPVSDDESEARSVERVRALACDSRSPAVLDAIADTLSRAMEGGATDSWARAFKKWRGESDRRLRLVGVSAFSHLLSRGKAPEKLFDGLMQARRLIADPDEDVRKAVVGLFRVGARKQPRAVLRFLDRFDEDEREEARALAALAKKKIGRRAAAPPGAMPAVDGPEPSADGPEPDPPAAVEAPEAAPPEKLPDAPLS
jgi:hypothetical protein